MFGETGNDVLKGNGGNDVLLGGADNDTIDGGADWDWASYYFSSNGVDANLSTGTATGEGTDRLVGIEDLEGSPFDDTLTGDEGENFFYPGRGDDAVGLVQGDVWLQDELPDNRPIMWVNDAIIVSPRLMVEHARIHFGRYVARLLNPSETELRQHFEDRFDFDTRPA